MWPYNDTLCVGILELWNPLEGKARHMDMVSASKKNRCHFYQSIHQRLLAHDLHRNSSMASDNLSYGGIPKETFNNQSCSLWTITLGSTRFLCRCNIKFKSITPDLCYCELPMERSHGMMVLSISDMLHSLFYFLQKYPEIMWQKYMMRTGNMLVVHGNHQWQNSNPCCISNAQIYQIY